MYKVFQIKISNEVSDFVNSNDRGHLGAEEKYPEYKAHMAVMHSGAKGFKGDMFNHYTQVCDVATFNTEGNHLEEVFKILNGYWYDDETGEDNVFDEFVSGFKMKTITRKNGEVVTYRDMHSLSVGDIVYDSIGDTYNIVDRWGFKDITSDVLEGVQQTA
jgi:hypothetical protein|tara:strand:+ start:682 stop:1161 length:480 start_codon:yes stop_codon:yes gene_type:complete